MTFMAIQVMEIVYYATKYNSFSVRTLIILEIFHYFVAADYIKGMSNNEDQKSLIYH